jgi:hypothetical protein
MKRQEAGWNPRAGLDAVEQRSPALAPTRNRTQTVQPVARRYTDSAIQTHLDTNKLLNNQQKQKVFY